MNVKSHVVEMKSGDECPIAAGAKFEHTYTVTPSKAGNEDVYRLALDGQLKDEDTGLASSTQLESGLEDNAGIAVSYEVKVKLHLGLARWVRGLAPKLHSASFQISVMAYID
eukprot:TRINITY_DN11574_c0_g1_i1.p3 TRINITY_DN11574_c0_g1~~TRINITY_DN11574_c0_g1_i1.p3  ORF type:complete len:112 (+),score=22.52 TRINITY_DN11574_c0_g1_i1:964-1299(+)